MASLSRTRMQHRIWRWHFFAGLMVIPFAVILAVTGAIYLFKPQVEASIEASINARAVMVAANTEMLSADAIVEAAMEDYPEGQFRRLTLPRDEADRTLEVEMRIEDGDRILWVDRLTGDVLHNTAKGARVMNFAKNIHGNLLVGNAGSYLVEFMACWMIVLIVTGFYLWWPRGTTLMAMFTLQLKGKPNREKLRELHGVGGAWIGGMVLALLISGLPWTQVWGDGFDRVSNVMGWDKPGQEWTVTLQSVDPHAEHEEHNHDDGLSMWERGAGSEGQVTLQSRKAGDQAEPIALQTIVTAVESQALRFPVEIQPPRGENGVWSVRSMTQNRPDRATIHYDKWTGAELMRIGFTDRHPVQQIASAGIALHEGALFGWLNQLLGLIAASGVIALSITGGWMWWSRRPKGALGTPPLPADKRLAGGVIVLILILAVFLPLVGLSLITALALNAGWDKIIVRGGL